MIQQAVSERATSSDIPVDSVPGHGLRAPGGRAHRIPKIRGRAQEVAAMNAWRRWQDWVVVGLGVVLFLTPPALGQTAQAVSPSNPHRLGGALAPGGLFEQAIEDAGGHGRVPPVLR